ncbi:MAG: hypothetical protein K0R17_3650 [Rariglobus sp.]|jgi:prepilin-type N-terminal cleavage/methylation domain-containing protein|nr:hypothetical protein [Rariglobus sp.]
MHSLSDPAGFRTRSSGFTLTELLAVIAIIGVLAAILIPVALKVQASSRSTRCASNLRQMGTAMGAYAADHKGFLPAGEGGPSQGDRGGSLFARIDPYLGGNESAPFSIREDSVYLCQANISESNPTHTGYMINLNIFPCLAPSASPPATATEAIRLTNITKRRIMLSDIAKEPRYVYVYYGIRALETMERGYAYAQPEAVHIHNLGINALWSDFSVSWMAQAEVQRPNAEIPGGTYFGRAWDNDN